METYHMNSCYFIGEIYLIMMYLVEYFANKIYKELSDIVTFFSRNFLENSVVLLSKGCSFIYAHLSAKEFIPDKTKTNAKNCRIKLIPN